MLSIQETWVHSILLNFVQDVTLFSKGKSEKLNGPNMFCYPHLDPKNAEHRVDPNFRGENLGPLDTFNSKNLGSFDVANFPKCF